MDAVLHDGLVRGVRPGAGSRVRCGRGNEGMGCLFIETMDRFGVAFAYRNGMVIILRSGNEEDHALRAFH